MKKQVTVTLCVYIYVARECRIDIAGMTLRQALRALRSLDWDHGMSDAMIVIHLSDHSTIYVENSQRPFGVTTRPDTQVARRISWSPDGTRWQHVRTYQVRPRPRREGGGKNCYRP